jgi:hypothetical protein
VIPGSSPYITEGVPHNSSFQGREPFYDDLDLKFFKMGVSALALDAPGSFGKTTALKNLRRQPQFENTELVILSGTSQIPDLVAPGQEPTDFEYELAQVIFQTPVKPEMRSPTFLRECNSKFRDQGKYLLIAIDTIEDWFSSVVRSEVYDALHCIKYIVKDSYREDYDHIRWLFSGSWSLNPTWEKIWEEHLSGRRIRPTDQFRILDRESGHRVVATPVSGFIEYQEDALDRIGLFTGWHPHLTQILCSSLYVLAIDRAHYQVSCDIVEEASKSKAVIELVQKVWERTIESLQGTGIVLDVFRAIKALHGLEATENEILNAMAMASTVEKEEAECICNAIDLKPVTTNLTTLVPKVIDYLCRLGLLCAVDDQPRKYRLAAELFVRYIGRLPIKSLPQLRPLT